MKDILEKAQKMATEIGKNSKSVLKELKKIKMSLDKGNFIKLGRTLESTEFNNSLKELNMTDIYQELRAIHDEHTSKLRMKFDNAFVEACNQLNVQEVTGNSMDQFRIRGILHVRINFSKNLSEIKTFVRQKKIKSIDPEKVAKEVKKEIVRLYERPFEPKSFLSILFDAYQKTQSESHKKAFLKDVHRIIWIEKQKTNFFETSDPSKMVSFPLDEFSVDLGKLIESKYDTLDNGYTCKIYLGSGGINIYKSDGSFNSYKFLEFIKGGQND